MALTNLNNSKPPVSSDSIRDPYPDIVAKPLGSPDFINLKPKNPLMSLRWGNRTAGEGQRLDQLIAAGFRHAKPEEVFLPSPKGQQACPPSLARDGKIIYGDLVLLTISRAEYEGALKYNWERAISRLHPNFAKNTGKKVLEDTLKEVGVRVTPELTKRLQTFQPTDKDFTEIESGGSELKK